MTEMKKLFYMLVVVLPISMKAQLLSPSVISAAGNTANNASYSMSYTIGEMAMVQTFAAEGNILTQGFQQPSDVLLSALAHFPADESGSFIIYPNPAVDNLWFGFQYPQAGDISVALYNATG